MVETSGQGGRPPLRHSPGGESEFGARLGALGEIMNTTSTARRSGALRILVALITLLSVLVMGAPPAAAHAPSGAIFTTLPDGSAVNFNIYDSKDDVYLDGGPGIQAPQTAAGLDDGTYVFQVTDPSGKNLLSLDEARCRQFTVSNGVIDGVVATGCEHATGFDVDHGAVTVQLMPYADTPNPGGVYKVWVTEVGDFLAGCAQFGVANGLDVVDCGNRGGNRHGFVPAHSKTDNFKVGDEDPVEIDTRFTDETTGDYIDGLMVTWEDTNGATNIKWSEWAPEVQVFHEAHVEAVERGVHRITIDHQPGCFVHHVRVDGVLQPTEGPQTVEVRIKNDAKPLTVFIDVDCHTD